ncbi:MAG: dynamin family protein [Sulfurospirillaceae bacterium]|nr:dynamin family protein [Sulfurospirillaceae bacterium]
MHILNDFFLLAWNEDSDSIDNLPGSLKEKILFTFENNYDDFCDSCSILFIISSENLDKITQIEEFKLLFDGLLADVDANKKTILQAQKETLRFIDELGDLSLNTQIKSRFEILRKEGIISYYVSRRLIGLFELIKENKPEITNIVIKEAKKDDLFYKNSLNILNTSIENLKNCIQNDYFVERLDSCTDKLKEEKLSIGITGVMNAGKSTMLNAILGEEVLGTSVVPETANLTILKYSKNKYAKVHYWTKNEFDKISSNAKDSPSIEKFVSETKSHFENDLDKFITDDGKSEEISIEDLHLFTSAKESNKKCNLVKSVELYSDLSFLQDGVEIVDTPGLDDPIIQREEITLQYTLDCDLMVHLMNVNQSATKKDVDFIIDAIIYQNIARLLIVITRIDTVSEEELEEVVEYTKRSIKQRLEEQNKSAQLKMILEKIDFIPISGKMALLHKLGKSDIALENGYDLERTGILKIENYLNQVLFGEESIKANLIIQSNLIEIMSVLLESEKNFEDEIEFLSKSKEEIQKEFEEHKKHKTQLLTNLDSIKKNIDESKLELTSYFKTLEKYSQDSLTRLKNIIKKRVTDDVSYEMRKNKKLPKQERIEYFIQTGIKDGLVDLARDYRYEFQKKMQTSYDHVKNSFEDFDDKEIVENQKFDSQDFFDKYFKKVMIFQNSEILVTKVNSLIKKYSNKNLEELDTKLGDILAEEFENIKTMLSDRLVNINQELLDNFITFAKTKVQNIEMQMKMKDDMIENSIRTIERSSVEKTQRVEDLKNKLNILQTVKNELQVLDDKLAE